MNDVLEDFDDYTNYLDSLLTKEDLYFLGRYIGRLKLEFSSNCILSRDQFTKNKQKQRVESTPEFHGLFSQNLEPSEALLIELQQRERANQTGLLLVQLNCTSFDRS